MFSLVSLVYTSGSGVVFLDDFYTELVFEVYFLLTMQTRLSFGIKVLEANQQLLKNAIT